MPDFYRSEKSKVHLHSGKIKFETKIMARVNKRLRSRNTKLSWKTNVVVDALSRKSNKQAN